MPKQGPITTRHVVVAGLVLLVVNAQLTWWIVFVLRLNRSILDSERNALVASCERMTMRVRCELEATREQIRSIACRPHSGTGLEMLPAAPLPEGIERWLDGDELRGRPGWWRDADGTVVIEVLCAASTRGGVVEHAWLQELLVIPETVEVAPVGSSTTEGLPCVRLPAPFDASELRPAAAEWDRILHEYRRRIVMMVSEASFFALLLLVLMSLLWRSFRREVALERQHGNFLSAITHELKSPLAAIRLALETVISGRATAVVGERFLKNAMEDTGRLQDLVQKVLEVTRYGKGGPPIELSLGNLSVVVNEAVEVFSRRAEAGGVEMSIVVTPGLRGQLDCEALAIAISNLLENAVKYGGDPPRITVRVQPINGDAVIDVGDNGGGIPPEEVRLIFQRFYRTGNELTRRSPGTGLGLYLVQQIVKAHRGKVAVAATGPGGTTFRIRLPGFEVQEDAI